MNARLKIHCFLIEISENTDATNNDGDDDNDKTQMANNLIKAAKSFLICSIHKHKKDGSVCLFVLLDGTG